jgi:Fe-S cluster biogenesis protein NfuA
MTDTTVTDASAPEAGAKQVGVDLAKLEETLEYIRPAIQMDGGDLLLLGVEDGTVNLQMVGACGGCPMSMMTLKAGIERILKDRVPGVVAVDAS